MKCSKCGYALPDDSVFCQYCGNNLSESFITDDDKCVLEGVAIDDLETSRVEAEPEGQASPSPISDAARVSKKKQYCKSCGGILDSESQKCLSCGKQYFRLPRKTVLFALIILVAALLCINIYQYLTYGRAMSANTSTISALEQQIAENSSTIAIQKTTIASLENEMSDLEVAAGHYDDICALMSGGNIGYAANNFRSSESIIVLRKTDMSRKFTLTANWSSGGNVSLSYSAHAAHVSFDNSSWSTSTTMTVEPLSEGTTVVTFSNDVDSSSFKMLIIVTQ